MTKFFPAMRTWFAVTGGLLCSFCIWSRPPEPPAEAPKLNANVHEVIVDLVVRDKKGKLVRDLQPGELTITDDGVAVKVKDLQLITGSGSEGATKPGTPQTARLITFVFERLGVDAGKLARETADEMLKSDNGSGLYFSVLQVNRRLRLLQQFTTDRAALERAVDAATLGAKSRYTVDASTAEKSLSALAPGPQSDERLRAGDVSVVSGLDMGMASMMMKTLHDSEQIGRDLEAVPSLASLLALVQHQGSLPGRKTVVYFSEGLPLTARSKETLRSVVETANRSGVSVYTVDVSGVSLAARTEAGRLMLSAAAQASLSNVHPNAVGGAAATMAPAGAGAPPGLAQTSYQVGGISADQVHSADRVRDINSSDVQSSLVELAAGTGGFFIGESNDLRKPARRLMEDVASHYQASYIIDPPKYDARFHPIAVKVGRPKVTVQARSGYMAVPPGTPVDFAPFEAPLMKILSEPVLPRELEFRSEIIRFGPSAAGVSASLAVEIPLRQMEFREDANTKTFEVHPAILAFLRDETGKVVWRSSQDLPFRGATQAMEPARNQAYTFQRSFTLPPGKLTLELALSDVLSGRFAAERRELELTAPPQGAALSDISLVRRYDALPESSLVNEPFRYQNSRVVPNLARTVDKEQQLSAFFVIYPDSNQQARPKLELEFGRNGARFGRSPLELPAATSPGPVPFVASIPAAAMRPGVYDLYAILTHGTQVVEQKTSFTVEGAEPPPVDASVAGSGAAPASEASPLEFSAVITRLDNAARPQPVEQKQMLAYARQRAMEYSATLPNFTCIQRTRRWIDRTGQQRWLPKDIITELLRYQDREEIRQMLEVNGQKVDTERSSLRGVLSYGEFGMLLEAVFDPASKAEFTWKEMASIANQTCHGFAFHVDAANSKYALRAGPKGAMRLVVGFHGIVYIDAAGYAVRRIAIEADNIAPTFPVQASAISVDYDLVEVGEHDYMLPSAAEILVRSGKRDLVKNEISFRNYRRFGANSTIQFSNPQ